MASDCTQKLTIPVKDIAEGDAIFRALADPVTRALVVVLGTLQALPTDQARRRVLTFVADRLEEERQKKDNEIY